MRDVSLGEVYDDERRDHFANLDLAITMAQRGVRKETAIHFANAPEALEVKETPEDLISSSAAGRGMRRTDIG